MSSTSMTTILAGDSLKPFKILTDLLTSKSPYFREMLGGSPTRRDSITNLPTLTDESSQDSDATLSFPELNEFAFSLFNRWLYGAQLPGPTDFHSMQHYLGLYILALRFQIEKLENEVMDLVRGYSRGTQMTAPPYRLEYVYKNTKGANKMRSFLVVTAAYRAVTEGVLSDVMKETVGKGGELATDYVEALVKLKSDGVGDVRQGNDCTWHSHVDTRTCRKSEEDGVGFAWA